MLKSYMGKMHNHNKQRSSVIKKGDASFFFLVSLCANYTIKTCMGLISSDKPFGLPYYAVLMAFLFLFCSSCKKANKSFSSSSVKNISSPYKETLRYPCSITSRCRKKVILKDKGFEIGKFRLSVNRYGEVEGYVNGKRLFKLSLSFWSDTFRSVNKSFNHVKTVVNKESLSNAAKPQPNKAKCGN